ncbi:hypothetical protein TNCV_2872241 [Trichonephila clavipes]|nr:hypothetical protein TNCV_2872241 [Trichonephila clavipes]
MQDLPLFREHRFQLSGVLRWIRSCCQVCLPKSFHICWMIFKAGKHPGQSIYFRYPYFREAYQQKSEVLCERALSSIKIKSGPIAPLNKTRVWEDNLISEATFSESTAVDNVELRSSINMIHTQGLHYHLDEPGNKNFLLKN